MSILDLPAADYHNDPCEQPSLSASIASILYTQSPAHARAVHPRLNPQYERKQEDKFDLGTVVHSLVLQGTEIADVLAFPDYRSGAAKEARDIARTHGRIPMLVHQAHEVEQMVAAVKAKLAALPITPALLTDGQPEQTLTWNDGGVECRARLDWLRDDYTAIDDLKTTSRSANPTSWCRSTLWGIGADIQAAFYLRGLKAITGVDAEFRWIVAETSPPFELSVISLTPAALAVANEKVDWALETWARCLETDEWPGYPTEVCYAELPAWEESRWLEKEAAA
jgi:hypothetical protein